MISKKVILVSSYSPSLTRFRGPLIDAIVAAGHRLLALGPEEDADVTRDLRTRGASFAPYPLARTGMNPFADARSLAHLRHLFRDMNPDVVISYTHKPVVYASLAAHEAGVPEIYSLITGLGTSFISRSLKARIAGFAVQKLLRAALAKNRRIFVYNADIADALLAWRVARDDQLVQVAGSGVDLVMFPAAPLPRPMVFLLVARLLGDKGIREYVAAARTVRARHRSARFVLVGPFDTNASALGRAEVAAWVKEGVVEYAGETNDVGPFMRAASVYVLPSYAEGIPRTVLEAMATGRAIVTTDAPGCRDTVVDGENGFLVPPRDSAALARAMERFLEQPSLVKSMGRASRSLVELRFDVRIVNKVLLSSMNLIP